MFNNSATLTDKSTTFKSLSANNKSKLSFKILAVVAESLLAIEAIVSIVYHFLLQHQKQIDQYYSPKKQKFYQFNQ